MFSILRTPWWNCHSMSRPRRVRLLHSHFIVSDPDAENAIYMGPVSVYVLGTLVIVLAIAICMIRWAPWLKPCLDPPPPKKLPPSTSFDLWNNAQGTFPSSFLFYKKKKSKFKKKKTPPTNGSTEPSWLNISGKMWIFRHILMKIKLFSIKNKVKVEKNLLLIYFGNLRFQVRAPIWLKTSCKTGPSQYWWWRVYRKRPWTIYSPRKM